MRISFFTVLIALFWNINVNAQDINIYLKDSSCHATIDDKTYKCAIGKNGITSNKIEGDGRTPIGNFPLREIFFRSNKISSSILKTNLPIKILTINDGWCDEPGDKNYNKFVNLQNFDLSISHEKLYRDDDLYDIIVVVGYNDDPVVPKKGSAIFIHIAEENYAGTAGCIAFAKGDLLEIISKLDKDSHIIILDSYSKVK